MKLETEAHLLSYIKPPTIPCSSLQKCLKLKQLLFLEKKSMLIFLWLLFRVVMAHIYIGEHNVNVLHCTTQPKVHCKINDKICNKSVEIKAELWAFWV